MRRITVLAAAVLGLGLFGQASAFAGFRHHDDCSGHKCHSLSAIAGKLGFSYFCCGAKSCKNSNCPPYIYPNRAPRDFWMLP
jgi:hypothetical protein